MKATLVVTMLLLFPAFAFAHTSAAELNNQCDALKAKGQEVYSIDRNSNLAMCIGYMNAVLDSFQNNDEIQILKDFIIGDMIQSFQRYAPQHYAELASRAIVNAMIADGFLKRRSKEGPIAFACGK